MTTRIASNNSIFKRLLRNAGSIFLLLTVLTGIFAMAAPQASAQGNPVPVQTFYVPFAEDNLLQAFRTITGTTTPKNPFTTYISIAAIADNTIIYYDQWENGYDPDIANPSNLYSAENPGGTQIWGDGDPANGAPPGFPEDIINAGNVIILNNSLDTSTLKDVIDFDGRDKIASSKNVTLSRTGWASGSGTFLAGCVEMYDTSLWGTYYLVPVGEDIPDDEDYQIFEYTGLEIMAGEGGAFVQVDADADGSFETELTLAEGQSISVSGGVLVGGKILSDQPVQVDIITGDIGSNYESRDSALLPVDFWSNSYYTPASTSTSNPNYGTSVWLYNPGESNLEVTYTRRESGVLTSDSLTVPAGSYFKQVLPDGTGAHFSAGSDFYAFSATDSTDSTFTGTTPRNYTRNQYYDWGFTLIPHDALTPQLLVGLGIGRDPTSSTNPTENGNPLWITTAGNGDTPETVYVDYDADPNTGAHEDPYGNKYDISLQLKELEQAKIYDIDGDQSGLLVYVLNTDVKLAGAWGQDPTKASVAAPGLDVGTSVPPCPLFSAGKNGVLKEDSDGDGFITPGDTIQYTVVINNIGRVLVANIHLEDTLPQDTVYVPNSTYFGIVPIPDDVTGTAFPLDESGVDLGPLPVRQSFTVTFQVTIKGYADLSESTSVLLNNAWVTGLDTTLKVHDTTPIFGGIGDLVWNDANGNGIQDPGEKGIPNVTVNLYNSDGTILLDTTTDANGNYFFNGLLPGSYTVGFVAPEGYKFSPQKEGTDDTLDSDADPATGEASVTLTGGPGLLNLSIDAGLGPGALTLEKTATPSTYKKVGDVISYSYKLINTGDIPLTGPFSVTDDKVVTTSTENVSSSRTLNPGQYIIFTASYYVTQADLNAGSVTNTAQGHGVLEDQTIKSNIDEATVVAVDRDIINTCTGEISIESLNKNAVSGATNAMDGAKISIYVSKILKTRSINIITEDGDIKCVKERCVNLFSGQATAKNGAWVFEFPDGHDLSDGKYIVRVYLNNSDNCCVADCVIQTIN